MKYTRYDIKKRNKDNYALFIVLFSVLIASYVLGSGLSNLFIKNPKPKATDDKSGKISSDVAQGTGKESTPLKVENTTVRFVCIQNGLFENKDNAEVLKNRVKEVLNPFNIIEENKTRVLGGIYKETDVQKYIQLLEGKGIESSTIKFEVKKNDKCDAEIVEITNGYVEILSKLLEKDVKSIQTASFKQYVNSLEEVENTSKNYSILSDLKKHVGALPEAITKEKVEENYVYLFGVLKKMSGK